MDDDWVDTSLPTELEVEQVFKDFRQVLKASRFHTPLQRINHYHSSQSVIALQQRKAAELETVFNLLQPGHDTCLRVDFLPAICDIGEHCSVKIPVTMFKRGEEVVVMRNNKAGQVVYRSYCRLKTAIMAFEKETESMSFPRPLFPRYVHKSQDRPMSLLLHSEEILPLWLHTPPTCHQYVQEFIQPATKTVSLIRTHWKDSKPTSVFYISKDGNKGKFRETAPRKMTGLARSSSEATLVRETDVCISYASSSLLVRKNKPVPELDRYIQEIIRVINVTLGKQRKIVEIVCDFIYDSGKSWVFLACKGFKFSHKGENITQIVQQKQGIDIRYLMYPVIANKTEIQKRLFRKNSASNFTLHRRNDLIGSAISHFGRLPGVRNASFSSEIPLKTENTETDIAEPSLERDILTRDVAQLDLLLQKSRKCKLVLKNKIDMVEKYGGMKRWLPTLHSLYHRFYSIPEIYPYFEEQIGFEEHSLMIHVISKIFQGGYSFYYKELLGNLHKKHEITVAHYDMFVSVLRDMMAEAGMETRDMDLAVHRFRELQAYICSE